MRNFGEGFLRRSAGRKADRKEILGRNLKRKYAGRYKE